MPEHTRYVLLLIALFLLLSFAMILWWISRSPA